MLIFGLKIKTMTNLGIRLTIIIFALPITIGCLLWGCLSVIMYLIGKPIDNIGEYLYYALFLICSFVYYCYHYIIEWKKIRIKYKQRYYNGN